MSDETTTITPEKQRSFRGLIISGVFIAMAAALSYQFVQYHALHLELSTLAATQNLQDQNHAEKVASLEQGLQKLSEGVSVASQSLNQAPSIAGDANHLTVAEAAYLVNLANDQLQYTHNQTLALNLLQRASQILANLEDPNLNALKQSLADNVATLTAAPTADLTGLYMQLSTLNADLNRLPLPATPLSTDENTDDKLNVSGLPWWKAQWRRTMHTLGKVVIVRYNGGGVPPLVLPEERVFIYQNLHAQMENVFWALLNRDAGVYQAALMRMHLWIAQYFDVTSPITQSVLQQLQALSTQPIAGATVNLGGTLEQFTQYLHQPKA
ncbi:MAG TPA: uroporphyrinogen-III C-methyltransferase [Gammaproteobacteria bacterium]|nr:uroporphyrinogen-III C-methyltransferase [Gammaproteobacteria bacterium]